TEFDSLEAEWTRLLEESDATVFQSFEWQRTWWKHFGEQDPLANLHIVTLRNGGRLVAIAPLYIESMKKLGMIRLRRLGFIGGGITDYLDVVVAKGYETSCLPVLASHIADQSSLFDVIHLTDISDRSPNRALLYQELSRLGFRGSHFVSDCCPRMQLRETWEATVASLPSSKQKRFRQVQRKIESDFKVELHVVTDPDQLPRDFTEFFNLHQKRWNESGQSGVLADARTAGFHREISELFFKRKRLFLAFLLLDGRRVAANYGFVYRKELLHYLSGIEMRAELSKYSIGRVLQMYSIAEAAKQGIKVYDFMRGPEEYKYDFNSVDVTNWTVLMYPSRTGFIELKFKMMLLIDSMRRRANKERLLWSKASKGQGVLSRAMAAHVAKRIRTNIGDGIQKLRSPEKSLTNRE
ncbi:MAG: GNAT family N-acetyltransferase, partial [Bacteroidota bacterium]